jgi:hypothetical protein
MSSTTHATEIPSVEQIDARLQSCFDELQALKRLRRAAVAYEQAEQARLKRQDRRPARQGVQPCP